MPSFLRHFLLRGLIAASAALVFPAQAQPANVRVQTTMGAIDMSLLADAPVTVANFAVYARAAWRPHRLAGGGAGGGVLNPIGQDPVRTAPAWRALNPP